MTLDAIESGGQAAVVNAVEFRNKHFYGTRVKRVPGKSYLHICDIFDNNA
jgi:hypothetical protein